MSAYNARLKPKEIFGLPIYAVGSFMFLLPVVTLTIIVPIMFIKVLMGLLSVVALIATIFFFVIGDELTFIKLRWMTSCEEGCVTSETWGKW